MSFRDPIEWERTLPIRPSSPAWCATVKAVYGSPLTADEAEFFVELSGGVEPPVGGALEFLAVAGRRGGKSETIARLATFEAIHGGHTVALAPGQLGLIPVISPLREQSGEILRYIKGLAKLKKVAPYVESETADSVTFRSGVQVRVMTADAVNVSGPTVVTAIRDEWAKYPGTETTMPDTEIDNSLRPALAPVEGAPPRRLIGITSAYIKDGLAFETDRDNFGKAEAPVLVVRGASSIFNPNLSAKWLEREKKRVGAVVFAREYEATWVDAYTEGWFGAPTIDQCVDTGRKTAAAAPNDDVNYYAAIDAAFRGNRFALAIAHREHDAAGVPLTVVDGVWWWSAPRGGILGVEETVEEVAALIALFGAVTYADQFGIDPLTAIFWRHRVDLHEAPWTAASKPARFAMVRNAMADERVSLPDEPALIREFHGIQGRLLRSGGERIEGRGHDDLVHAAVLAMSIAMEHEPEPKMQKERDADLREQQAHHDYLLRHDPQAAGASRWTTLPGKGF